jgi:urease accessory protein UreF
VKETIMRNISYGTLQVCSGIGNSGTVMGHVDSICDNIIQAAQRLPSMTAVRQYSVVKRVFYDQEEKKKRRRKVANYHPADEDKLMDFMGTQKVWDEAVVPR